MQNSKPAGQGGSGLPQDKPPRRAGPSRRRALAPSTALVLAILIGGIMLAAGVTIGRGWNVSSAPPSDAVSPAPAVGQVPDRTGTAPSVEPRGRSVDPRFVTRSGAELILEGVPYRFAGVNIFNANSDGWCWYEMDNGSYESALDNIGLGDLGNGVIRAWFFQPLAAEKGTGERIWERFDRTVQAAAERGYRIIVTLTDQWAECGDTGISGYKTDEWYRTGYREADPVLLDEYGGSWLSYRDWVAEVVRRYRDEPAILAWQLINEAEVRPQRGASCEPGDEARDLLVRWATDMSELVRSIAPNHLISLGSIGEDQCGLRGDDYRAVHAIPTIDLCEYHDYGTLDPLPADPPHDLRLRLEQCRELGKPLFVGEMGVALAEMDGDKDRRAAVLGAKMQAQAEAGAAGVLLWKWNEGPPRERYDISPGDPVVDRLRAFALSLRDGVAFPGAETGTGLRR